MLSYLFPLIFSEWHDFAITEVKVEEEEEEDDDMGFGECSL